MSENIAILIEKISDGEILHGAYVRRDILDWRGMKFEELIVRTASGTEYCTRTERDCNAFLALVDYQGCCVNSEALPDGCRYESLAYWNPA